SASATRSGVACLSRNSSASVSAVTGPCDGVGALAPEGRHHKQRACDDTKQEIQNGGAGMSEDNKSIRTFVKRFVNPILRNVARLSLGPFALLRHVGRRSGKQYEIPIMVRPVAGGFVIELSYGRKVDWLRNLQAAGHGSLRWRHREFTLLKPEFIDAE